MGIKQSTREKVKGCMVMDNVNKHLRNKKREKKVLNYTVLTLITYTLYKMVVM